MELMVFDELGRNLEQVLITSHGGLDERIGEGLVRAEAEHTRGVQAFRLLLGE
jgi:hypothetical protein